MKRTIQGFLVLCCLLMLCSAVGCSIKQELQDELNALRGESVEQIDSSAYYDEVLAVGIGKKIVIKHQETLDRVWDEVGLIDDDMNWIVPLSEDTPLNPDGELEEFNRNPVFAYDMDAHESKLSGYAPTEDLFDTESGVFVWADKRSNFNGLHYYEAKRLWDYGKNEWHNISSMGRFNCPEEEFSEGYMVTVSAESENVMLLSEAGDVVFTDVSGGSPKADFIGKYSEGVFFAYNGFYDINGHRIINLSQYAGRIINQPFFSDGQCELIAVNANGTQYSARIDADGNFLSEFKAVK